MALTKWVNWRRRQTTPLWEGGSDKERMSKYRAVAFFFRFAVSSAAAETFIGITASVASNDDIYSHDSWPNLTLFGKTRGSR